MVFQIPDRLSGCLCVFNFGLGGRTDITVNIDNKYLVGHINLALVHIVQHFLCAVSDFTEKADAENNITLQSEPLFRRYEFILEPRAAAQSDNLIFVNHM